MLASLLTLEIYVWYSYPSLTLIGNMYDDVFMFPFDWNAVFPNVLLVSIYLSEINNLQDTILNKQKVNWYLLNGPESLQNFNNLYKDNETLYDVSKT